MSLQESMDEQAKEKIKAIIDAYFSGPLPFELEEDVRSWLFYEGHEEEKAKWLKKYWDEQVLFERKPEDEAKVLKSLAALKRRLGLPAVEIKPQDGGTKAMRRILNRKVWRAAAVLIPALIIVGALWLWRGSIPDVEPVQVLAEITTTDRPQEIALPDGSRIWLKKESTLSYPEKAEIERTVYLTGEAYFQVERDEQLPFVVHTDEVAIRVLGTEFYVRAGLNTPTTEVTLYSGSIEALVQGEVYRMKEREQLTYNHDDQTVTLISIPTGQLLNHRPVSFEYRPLEEVFQAIEERFPVSVTGNRKDVANEPVTLHLTGDETLEVILARLRNITGSFTYEIEEQQIIITTL